MVLRPDFFPSEITSYKGGRKFYFLKIYLNTIDTDICIIETNLSSLLYQFWRYYQTKMPHAVDVCC
jgi:hypothetical protein